MAKIPFYYYMHDDSFWERHDSLQEQDPRFTEELLEKMGKPFYEIKLHCEVDSETGEVTILSGE